MNGQRYRETPLDIERLRRLNRATVERYMDHGKRRTPGFPGP